jgi:hypothetical protein
MKRVWLTLLALVCIASVASALEVTSENVAGAIRVNVPAGQLKIVGINLDAIDPADANLQSIFGGQLTEGGPFAPQDADKIKMWDTASSSYKLYGIRSDDHLFHDAQDGTTWFTGSPVNPAIQPGDSFWIQATSKGDVNVTLLGQAVEDVNYPINIVTGLQFVAYPLSSSINVQDTSFFGDGAKTGGDFTPQNADKIKLWTGTGYDIYGLHEDGNWYKANSGTEWFSKIPADFDLELGAGVFYDSKGSFIWNEGNEYLDNL